MDKESPTSFILSRTCSLVEPPTPTFPPKLVKENIYHALATTYGNHSCPWSKPLGHDQVPTFSLILADGWSNHPSYPCSLAMHEHSMHIPWSRAYGSQPTRTRSCLSVTVVRPPSSSRFSRPHLLAPHAYYKFSRRSWSRRNAPPITVTFLGIIGHPYSTHLTEASFPKHLLIMVYFPAHFLIMADFPAHLPTERFSYLEYF